MPPKKHVPRRREDPARPPGAPRPRRRSAPRSGPHGVQTMEFCKQYNAATESQRGSIIPVEITIYEDRTFTFVLKTPPTPVLLRQAAGLDKGASTTGREQVGTVTDAQLEPRSPPSSCPTSTRPTSRRPSARWRAPPARWASRSPAEAGRRTGNGDRGDQGKEVQGELGASSTASISTRRPRRSTWSSRFAEGQVRRDGRARGAPRGRPPQGRPDRPRDALAAGRHRADRPGGGLRRRREGGRGPRRPEPTWWAPTTWWRGSRTRASSTSTWPSPRPT